MKMTLMVSIVLLALAGCAQKGVDGAMLNQQIEHSDFGRESDAAVLDHEAEKFIKAKQN